MQYYITAKTLKIKKKIIDIKMYKCLPVNSDTKVYQFLQVNGSSTILHHRHNYLGKI